MVSIESILARPFWLCIALVGFCFSVASLLAQEDAVPTMDAPEPAVASTVDAIIPEPYPVGRYEKSWERNPFMQKVEVIEQKMDNFGKDWALGGIADMGKGGMRVTIVNKQTGKPLRLSSQDTPEKIEKVNDGIKLVEAHYSNRRSEQSADIEQHGVKATVTLDEALLARPLTAPAGAQPGGIPQPGAMGPRGAASGAGPVAALRGVPGSAQPLPPGSYPSGRPGYQAGVRTGAAGSPGQTAAQGQVQQNAAQQQGTVPYGTNPAQSYPHGGVPAYGAPGTATGVAPAGIPTVPTPTSRRRQLIPPPVYNTPR
jgi:hypothetical protein